MTWTKLRVHDWSEFSAELDKLGVKPPLDQSLVFRGQSKSKRTLLPKICRGPARTSSAARIIKLEDATQRAFASQAHMHLPSSVIPSEESTVLNWWFLMHMRSKGAGTIIWYFQCCANSGNCFRRNWRVLSRFEAKYCRGELRYGKHCEQRNP